MKPGAMALTRMACLPAGRRAHGVAGGYVDYRAALFPHEYARLLAAEERALEVDVQHLVILLLGEFLRRAAYLYARAVDQHVQTAEALLHLRKGFDYRRHAGYVKLDRHGLHAVFVRNGLGRFNDLLRLTTI